MSAKLGGGQTYLRSLLEHYRPREGVRVVALLPPDLADTLSRRRRWKSLLPRFSGGPVKRSLWARTRFPALLRELKADVLFCPGGYLSAEGGGVKTALTFQNMLLFAPRERGRYPLG